MTNSLAQLSKYSTIVADTGDFEAIAKYNPIDSTTNPSLILQAVKLPKYQSLVDKVIADNNNATSEQIVDKICVAFGLEILQYISGRVSTEIDANLSFDTDASVNKAHYIIDLYQQAGVDKNRILIKLAATWEGMQAAKILEQQGIHCNMTLLFSISQAMVCAQEKVTLISPFVGRILDWYKAKDPEANFDGANDPGVQSVTQIYNYYKSNGIKTEIMAASFRNTSEITQLAGCDLLTISPKLLEQLKNSDAAVKQELSDSSNNANTPAYKTLAEADFRLSFNADMMAVEKLAQGINQFIIDQKQLQQLVESKFVESKSAKSKSAKSK